MDLIIFAHPDNKKSHNALILNYVILRLKLSGRPFKLIDLYADGFDPVFRLTNEDKRKLALVERYQQLVSGADRLIFIFPAWWYNLPAILKGFVEHVFNSGLAYSFETAPEKMGIIERKLSGKTAIVINTYGRSKKEALEHGNPPRFVLDKAVLEFCGIKVTSRIEWFDVKSPVALKGSMAKEIDLALRK